VSDAMSTIGTDQTEFSFFERTVYLKDGRLTSTTGELAGAALDMATAVENTHLYVGVELDESIRMASQYPANYINQGKVRGNLAVGSQADFVELNEKLKVQSTWIAGIKVYKN